MLISIDPTLFHIFPSHFSIIDDNSGVALAASSASALAVALALASALSWAFTWAAQEMSQKNSQFLGVIL